MPGSLKQPGKNIVRELSRTRESMSEGWRGLPSRSSDALTHFSRNVDTDKTEATCKNGGLSIRLPKADSETSGTITVS